MNAFVRSAHIAALALPALAVALPVGASPLPPVSHPAVVDTRTGQGPLAHIMQVAGTHAAAASTGNFNHPYALATDTNGNVYVANLDGASVKRISTNLQVQPGSIATSSLPISIAVDVAGDIYVGSAASGIQEFNLNGSLLKTVTANASSPQTLAVDQYGDLFVGTSTGVAIDDPNGSSIVPDIFPNSAAENFSVSFSGPNVYAFSSNLVSVENGTTVLQGQGFAGGFATHAIKVAGSACNSTGVCWYDDFSFNTVLSTNFGSYNVNAIHRMTVPYTPGGIAYDAIRDRLFVADSLHNAVQVYSGSTLTYVTTIK